MKESDKYKLEIDRMLEYKDNDDLYNDQQMHYAIKHYRRALRIELYRESNIEELLTAKGYEIIPTEDLRVVIDTKTEDFGIVTFFPVGNKINLRSPMRSFSYGLDWLKENLLK